MVSEGAAIDYTRIALAQNPMPHEEETYKKAYSKNDKP